jgi:hypothetical protein
MGLLQTIRFRTGSQGTCEANSHEILPVQTGVVVGVPAKVTSVERRAVIEATTAAGASRFYLVLDLWSLQSEQPSHI